MPDVCRFACPGRVERGVLAALTMLFALALMASALAFPLPASADDTTCSGTIGAETVDGNVIVPDGAGCTLNDTTVIGNVLVGVGASLHADGATIDGDIQDDNNDAGNVTVTNSQVGGNVQLEQGTSVTVTGTDIGGDLQFEANSQELQADANSIGGNLQANHNTGGLAITDNTIDGNLQCQSNDPPPTGSGNVVHGSAEDQCAALAGDSGGGDDGGGDDGGDDDRTQACPEGQVPSAGFADTTGNVHTAAIECVVWYEIAHGTSATTYSPGVAATRAQMGSFIARLVETSGAALPAGEDQFSDVDPASVHGGNIERVAAAGIVQGVADGRYAPDARVTRAQMASFLARAFQFIDGSALPVAETSFTDIAGNTHEDNIRRVAGAGFAEGTTATTYSPNTDVRRDQMASFLARMLERFAADGRVTHPS